MTCPMTLHLGVYVLGAADARERQLVEDHLMNCPACRGELTRIAPLPALLARVPPGMVGAWQPGGRPARRLSLVSPPGRRGPRRRAVALGAAAVVAAGVAGGAWLVRPATVPAAPAVILTGSSPATHVHATAALTGTSWGTSIRLRISGVPLDKLCRLIVRSRTGGTEVSGFWEAWRAGPVSVPGSAAWRPSDIASIQVAAAGASLVTLTARPPAAGPSRQPERP